MFYYHKLKCENSLQERSSLQADFQIAIETRRCYIIEVLGLKHKWEDVRQQPEHMGTDSLTNETMIIQMNENMKILKSYISVQELMISQIKDSMERLLERVENGQTPLIGKKDIMEIFNKESDFALRFLRTAKSMGYGIQVGKEYYIKREELDKILSTYQGLKLEMG
ncbi:MAG TPA: hypothetical protein DEB74_12140 [Lachnospiraceae bacterium]|nr:hypothetical protein [Lachnospiraceae bacterium]